MDSAATSESASRIEQPESNHGDAALPSAQIALTEAQSVALRMQTEMSQTVTEMAHDVGALLCELRIAVPIEIYLRIAESTVPELADKRAIARDPTKGIEITAKPRCENAKYDEQHDVFRPDSFDCLCDPCQSRRRDPIREFIRSALSVDALLWRSAVRAFKQQANFVYHAEQEFPVYTAAILDDFMYSFGKGHNGKFVDPGIQRLTIVLRWKFEVGDQVSEPIDSDIENEMVDQIFLVTRMLCILQYYEICATLTFPGTSTCLAAAFMRLYSLRKSTAPAFDYGKPWRWWRWANVSRSGGDRTFGEICGDSKAKSLYIEGLQKEHLHRQDIFKSWAERFGPYEEGEEPWVQTENLQFKVDFSV